MRALRSGIVLISLVVLAACSAAPLRAGSSLNGGRVRISETATYSYTLGGAIAPCSFFRLVSDSGRVVQLSSRDGAIYLATGSWTGQTAYERPDKGSLQPAFGANPACIWTLTLTRR
jgi:hypothetical protein